MSSIMCCGMFGAGAFAFAAGIATPASVNACDGGCFTVMGFVAGGCLTGVVAVVFGVDDFGAGAFFGGG